MKLAQTHRTSKQQSGDLNSCLSDHKSSVLCYLPHCRLTRVSHFDITAVIAKPLKSFCSPRHQPEDQRLASLTIINTQLNTILNKMRKLIKTTLQYFQIQAKYNLPFLGITASLGLSYQGRKGEMSIIFVSLTKASAMAAAQ